MNKFQNNFSTFDLNPNQTVSLINSSSTQQRQQQYYQHDLPAAPPPYFSQTSIYLPDNLSNKKLLTSNVVQLKSNTNSAFDNIKNLSTTQLNRQNNLQTSTILSYISASDYSQSALPLKSGPLSESRSNLSSKPSAIYINNETMNYSSGYNNEAYQSFQQPYSIPIKTEKNFGVNQYGSRQTSMTSSGVISDFYTSKMSPPNKYNETGVHFSPSPTRSSEVGRATNSQTSTTINTPAPYPASIATISTAPKKRTDSQEINKKNKRNRMEELRQCCAKTPSKLCLLACCLLIIFAIIVLIILFQVFYLPTHLQFSWLAPELMRAGQKMPNILQMDVSGDQVRFELAGSLPFKNNFVSILDFKTNKIAIIDSSLHSGNQNLVCFVMELDRQNIPNMASLQKAAKNSVAKTVQYLGWQETWNFIPTVTENSNDIASKFFYPDISECRNARWVTLERVYTNQKNVKCSECYDFCLPEYGIENDYIRGESFLNILRRNCFYMYVPEWRSFAQASNIHENKNLFENLNSNNNGFGNSVNRISVPDFTNKFRNSINQNPALQNLENQYESKWISLQTIPNKFANLSNNALDNLQNNANNFRNQIFYNQFPQKFSTPNSGSQFQSNNIYPQDQTQFHSINENLLRQTLNNPSYNPSSLSIITDKNINQQHQQPEISLQQLLQQQNPLQYSFNSNKLNSFALDSNLNNNLLTNPINTVGTQYNVQQHLQNQQQQQLKENQFNENNNFDPNRSKLSQLFATNSNIHNQQPQQFINLQQQNQQQFQSNLNQQQNKELGTDLSQQQRNLNINKNIFNSDLNGLQQNNINNNKERFQNVEQQQQIPWINTGG